MSTFKGTFFKYDVALVDQALTAQPSVIEPLNVVVDDFIKFTQILEGGNIRGTVDAVEVLKVKLQGQGFSADGKTFIVSNASANGAYTVKAKITYTPMGATESMTNIHTFKVPVERTTTDITIATKQIEPIWTNVSSLPATNAVAFTPTNNGDVLKFSITISAYTAPETAKRIACSFDGNVLSFSQGFESKAKVSASGTAQAYIPVKMNYIGSVDNKYFMGFNYAAPSGSSPYDVAVINSLKIRSMSMVGKIIKNNDSSSSFQTTKLIFNVDLDATATQSGSSIHLEGEEMISEIDTDSSTNFTPATQSDTGIVINVSTRFHTVTATENGLVQNVETNPIKMPGALRFLFEEGAHISMKKVSEDAKTGEITYDLLVDEYLVMITDSSGQAINIYPKGMNYNEQIHFLTKDKQTVVAMAPAYTVYDNFESQARGKVFDITSDAGFRIPAVEEGVFKTRYIRISDLYNAIANKKGNFKNIVPELSDRLHALEVSLDSLCSATLESAQETEAEAQRLYDVKQKWKVVDIDGLA